MDASLGTGAKRMACYRAEVLELRQNETLNCDRPGAVYMLFRRLITSLAVAACTLSMTACASRSSSGDQDRGLLGGLLGGGSTSVSETSEAGIGVNSFLWRSSLEVLSFMPLSEVDPFGGVIITDWYANPELPNERFKATIYILDTRLRADALSVQLFKQVRNESGNWDDTSVDAATRIQIENAILTRARQLRIQTIQD